VEVTVTVPLVPPREVRPNASAHFYTRGKAVKTFREAARLVVVNALNTPGSGMSAFQGYYGLVELDAVVAWGKGARLLDHDNCIASLKPLIDGMSDALWDSRDAHVRIGRVTQTRGTGETVVTLRAVGDAGVP
jgi:hypothetical protein